MTPVGQQPDDGAPNSSAPCWCCSQKEDVQFLRRHVEVPKIAGDDIECTICYQPLTGCSIWVNKGCLHTCCLGCGLEHDRQKKANGQKPTCPICVLSPWEPVQCLRTWTDERREGLSVAAGNDIRHTGESAELLTTGKRLASTEECGASGDHLSTSSSRPKSNTCLLLQLAEEGVPKEDFSCSYWKVPFRPKDKVVRTTCCCRVFSKNALRTKFLNPEARKKLPANQRCLNPVCPSNERPSDFPEKTWVDFPELRSAKELRRERGIVAKFSPEYPLTSVGSYACATCSTVFGPGEMLVTACCHTRLCRGCVKVLRRCPSPLCAWCDTDPKNAGLPEPGSLKVSKLPFMGHTLQELQKSLGGHCGKVINPGAGTSAAWWVIYPARDEALLAGDRVKIEVEYFSTGAGNTKGKLLVDLTDEGWGKSGTLDGDDGQGVLVVAKGGPRLLLSDLRRTLIDRINSLPDMRQADGSSVALSDQKQMESEDLLPGGDALPTVAEIRLNAATFFRVVQVDGAGNRPVRMRDGEELRVEENWKLYVRPGLKEREREVEQELIAAVLQAKEAASPSSKVRPSTPVFFSGGSPSRSLQAPTLTQWTSALVLESALLPRVILAEDAFLVGGTTGATSAGVQGVVCASRRLDSHRSQRGFVALAMGGNTGPVLRGTAVEKQTSSPFQLWSEAETFSSEELVPPWVCFSFVITLLLLALSAVVCFFCPQNSRGRHRQRSDRRGLWKRDVGKVFFTASRRGKGFL